VSTSAPGVAPRALLAVSAGGALGSLARYGLELVLVPAGGDLPLATLVTNLLGCLLIGAVAVLVPDGSTARAFVGAGLLGGFTTFSTFAVGTRALLVAGEPATAAAYVAVSLVGSLAAVWCGARLARAGRERTGGQRA
jgi:CrcB protein